MAGASSLEDDAALEFRYLLMPRRLLT